MPQYNDSPNDIHTRMCLERSQSISNPLLTVISTATAWMSAVQQLPFI
jgi:hypothetical protein